MKLNYLIIIAAAVMGCLATGACATEPLPTGNANFAVESGHEYLLGPGDKVRVVVFEEPQLSGEFIVANDGDVAIPLIGDVKAGGHSITAFGYAVEEKLIASGLVKAPKVSSDVVAYRPFYVLGEVNKPGQYPYAIGMTVTKAVATAGGFSYRANSQIIYVTREGAAQEIPLTVTAATWIGPGDTIRVGERIF
ncbi:MAG: polysaccharide export protein [Alphaproteobacteria bacterium]|nr:MAG: polysaccharide export protein [Alphaproteobacteria bacterium]